MMDKQTASHLNERLYLLEMSVDQKSSTDIAQELKNLNASIHDLYIKTPEYRELYNLSKELDIWGNPESERDHETVETLDLNYKKQLILANYPTVLEAYRNIKQISMMDIPKYINFADSSKEIPDLQSANSKALQSKLTVTKLADAIHLLIVKSMIVLEKYTDLVIAENEYWVNIEDKLKQLNQKYQSLETQHLARNKY